MDSLDINPPPSGSTGEMTVHEDVASDGDDVVGFKAPADVNVGGIQTGDLLWQLPGNDGSAGQWMATDGLGVLAWTSNAPTATTATSLQTARTIGGVSFNGTSNINLPGVNAAGNQNTTGTAGGLTTQYIDWTATTGGASIANKPTIAAVVAAPTTATDTCTAGTMAYDSGFIYICPATDTWVRAALATW